jgi:hypothetical protein
MLAEDAGRLGYVVFVAALGIMACGRSNLLGIGSKDAGSPRDRELTRDLPADSEPFHADAAADNGATFVDAGLDAPVSSADGAAPDVASKDAGPDTPALGRDGSGPEATDKDAGPDTPALGRDGSGPEATDKDAGSDAHDAASDAAAVEEGAGVDGVGRDGDGRGPLACKGTLVLGRLPSSGTGTGTVSAASGDLNGDGRLDVVAANFGSDTVSVLLGKGDGTFAAKVDYATGSHPNSLAVGDLDGDGKLDLVVASAYDDTVGVLLGKGDGTFAAKMNYDAGRLERGWQVGPGRGERLL